MENSIIKNPEITELPFLAAPKSEITGKCSRGKKDKTGKKHGRRTSRGLNGCMLNMVN
ncbi:MAG: hypothetical protein ABFD29_12980 [Anaerolineaceae bacterium]